MPATEKRIVILGATGSIGRQTLEVIDRLNSRLSRPFGGITWKVHAVSANHDIESLASICRTHSVEAACCNPVHAATLGESLRGTGTKVVSGEDGLVALATDPAVDIVVMAIYGLDALPPLLAAITAGKRIALASKEALVAAGSFINDAEEDRRSIDPGYFRTIIPVDSEHSALWQLVADGNYDLKGMRSLTITASGGPFFGMKGEQLEHVTFEQAQAHPTWNMGAGINLNSATLFNKGLEVIEACYLFGVSSQAIDVLVEPTSRVHAMCELSDGTVFMHAGHPDMRVPIRFALTQLAQLPGNAREDNESSPGPSERYERLNLTSEPLAFHEIDHETFPAFAAMCRNTGPWWISGALIAANEVLSAAFKAGGIGFLRIGATLKELADNPDVLGLGQVEEQIFELARVTKAVSSWLTPKL